MRDCDILIAGGGLAGSTAAAMLARRGFGVTVVDPHATYPFDLRCEKLVGRQVDILRRTGLAEEILQAATFDGECQVVQFGRVVLERPGDQWGILYDTLVNTVRRTVPDGALFVQGKVAHVANGRERQVVTLATGEEISARLVIMANGLNSGLRGALGMRREDLSKSHCTTLAFDVQAAAPARLGFRALTWFPHHARDRIAYLTLFPVGASMRANLMVYRDVDDPWVHAIRQQPETALRTSMPGLGRVLGDVHVPGPVRVRPADLYVTRGQVQPGVVLVGDAYATSCPAAGTGADKVFTDVERLCNVHVPRWMATPGMDAQKIAQFYADPVKLACDRFSLDKAFRARSVSTGESLPWAARRWARVIGRVAVGTARRALSRTPLPNQPA